MKIELQHPGEMIPTTWVNMITKQAFVVIAPRAGHATIPDSTQTLQPCTFFDRETGLCNLHDKNLKPLEGKIIDHRFGKLSTVVIRQLMVDFFWNTQKGTDVLDSMGADFITREKMLTEVQPIIDSLQDPPMKVIQAYNKEYKYIKSVWLKK
jgi:hypothetical protein